jgi:hypothetical protein
LGGLRERDYLEELGVDGRIVKTDPEEMGWGHGLDCSGSE